MCGSGTGGENAICAVERRMYGMGGRDYLKVPLPEVARSMHAITQVVVKE